MEPPNLESLIESYDAQTAQLQSLLAYRVRDILLVASLYDSFTLSEGQHLTELISGTYYNLSLSTIPNITRVSTRRKALDLIEERPFDAVITMAQVGDMTAPEFGRAAKATQPGLPVFLVAYSALELHAEEGGPVAIPGIDRAFIWRGDVRLFLTIIKLLEDLRNAPHDTRAAGVRVMILIEDSVPFYSSYLPMLLHELVKQTNSLIAEEVNLGQRMLRRRLRPKVLLATSFEEGWQLFQQYRANVLCVISDVQFPRRGVEDPEAGLKLLRRIRRQSPETPLLLQSSRGEVGARARRLGAGFLRKYSTTILHDFRSFMLENLGFGDFVFRLPDGTEVARAGDVTSMVEALRQVPVEALEFHGLRHDFSNWLMARTEFDMASELRKLEVSDFGSIEEMRGFLRRTLSSVQEGKRRGHVEDFHAESFDASSTFLRIGGGSLGGKGRGLAFMHELLSRSGVTQLFEGVRVYVPNSAVIATDVFDAFIAENQLLEPALADEDDEAVLRRFLKAPLPGDVRADLRAYLTHVRWPIAVRSSSLLEDSQMLPAAGIYPTHMLPNDDFSLQKRLRELEDAIRHIYAATYFRRARAYLSSTANLVEDEKMAVVLQEVVGRRHGRYVYPDLSGTADSHNYYPVREMRPDEGVANVALGLGKTVVAGERTVRFSPAHPQWLPQFSTPEDILDNAQREFRALDMQRSLDFSDPEPDDANIVKVGLDVAEADGTLWPVASVFSAENEAVYDGLSRVGVRLVTMAPILKHRLFPLPEILRKLLELGEMGMSVPVEVEFAVDLQPTDGGPRRFALLQIRPLGARGGFESVRLDDVQPAETFVRGSQVLGGGRHTGIHDIVVVRRETFDRAHTPDIARDVGAVNAGLRQAGRTYVLIGPGRWGTADRWLGVPVRWEQITNARVIVECPIGTLEVEPSQGTHFFHNLTSLGMGYFTIHEHSGAVDWDWIESLEPAARTRWIAHYRLESPMEVLIDGRSGEGVILKPR